MLSCVGIDLARGRYPMQGVHRNLYGIHTLITDFETEKPESLIYDT
jgi:hypothetical protein